ncbi:helix-turn-helix transcriptional regulator [Cohnella xylanilytica]|uniref:Helix-turn-helix transcriptional regulator n=1 Tax=Cohnella xylanilytica TaxID=557555 RepID=A0A841TRK8_9BACL|nr:helix-turn-helix transcriptional regulator [Cohnella xylanilytica]
MRYAPDRCLLRQILKSRKIPQRWLCEVTGYPESQISDYVNNRTTMGYATAVTIAKHLGIHPEELYTWKVID